MVDGFKLLVDINQDPSFLKKNLFWYKFEYIFSHISILYLTFFNDEEFIKDMQKHYFEQYKDIIKEPLLSGVEIANILHLKPSKEVGIVKERLLLAQLEGKVKTKEEAVNFIKNIEI